ncbi:MAG: branched-chain amino acid ABC transporter permease, partial [Oscillospiraceae bacterium]|nr:branched-chain amino acid ABC transporter permease [Oscillospiraceae bacterium]
TDETFSLLISAKAPEGIEPRAFELWIAALDQAYWVAGSVAGSLIAGAIPFDPAGVDFAMTALFVVIFIEQWRGGKGRPFAVIGVACALACRALFGAQWFLLPSMAAILLALPAARRLPGAREGDV